MQQLSSSSRARTVAILVLLVLLPPSSNLLLQAVLREGTDALVRYPVLSKVSPLIWCEDKLPLAACMRRLYSTPTHPSNC